MFERARRGRGFPGSERASAPEPQPIAPSPREHAEPSELRLTAIGHATFLMQLGELNVLTDPMFGERASPFAFAGPRRRQPPGLPLTSLPPIDLVLQSHDHYDHLDLGSVRALRAAHPGATWCAPLGVAGRLRTAGVERVVECDWWETVNVGGAEVTCIPAAHFSGRTPFDRDATLWCGWSVRAGGRSACFVGDSGMHPEFAAIGARCGPWDAVLMPIGAYAPRWFMRPVHLDPAEAVDAFVALTGSRAPSTTMVAMHWGTFPLSDEPVDEPPRLVREAWQRQGLPPGQLWLLSPGEAGSISSGP